MTPSGAGHATSDPQLLTIALLDDVIGSEPENRELFWRIIEGQ